MATARQLAALAKARAAKAARQAPPVVMKAPERLQEIGFSRYQRGTRPVSVHGYVRWIPREVPDGAKQSL